MKKLLTIFTAILLSLSLSGCFGYHKITVRKNHQENVTSYPRRAKAGETVTIYTVSVTDADLYVNYNGISCKYVEEGVYEFVMPDCDVEITVVIKSNGLA